MQKIKILLKEIQTFFKGLIFDKNGIPSLTDSTYLVHMTIGWGLVIYIVLVYFPDIDWRLFAVLIAYQIAMMILKFTKTFSISYRDIQTSFSQGKNEEEEQ